MLSLFTVSSAGRLELQQETLRRVLLADDVRDQPVIPVAMTGAFRRGKSFLLNVLMRYLQSGPVLGGSGGGGGGDWLSAGGAPLSGFPWRGGRQAHTRGIQIWSRPLPVTLGDGTSARVLLLDSQGAFDNVSSPAESVAVRAAAGLLSAVQVVSVSRQLQSDDLQQTRLCAEYGRLWADAAGQQAGLQTLVMLVRDWPFPSEAAYGADGGRPVLDDWLRGAESGDGTALRSAVSQLHCYLLPHPGTAAAAGGPQFSGAVDQLSAEFAAELRRLGPWLLGGGRGSPRRLGGRTATGSDLAALCRALVTADTPPPPENLADALTAAAVQRARAAALKAYIKRLETSTSKGDPLSDEDFQLAHRAALKASRRAFTAAGGGDSASSDRRLSAEIEQHHQRAATLNRRRRAVLEARAASQNTALASDCWDRYEAEMRRAVPGDGPAVSERRLRQLHAAAADSALQRYDCGRRDAGAGSDEPRRQLQQWLETRLETYCARNAARLRRDREAAEEQRQRARQAAEEEAERRRRAAETAAREQREREEAAAAAERASRRQVARRRSPSPEHPGLAAVVRLVAPQLAAVRAVQGLAEVVGEGAEVTGRAVTGAVEDTAQVIVRGVANLFRW